MILYGSDGNTYTILNKFAGGGEGDLHNVEGYPSLVAKVFHNDKLGKPGRWAKVEEWSKMTSLGSVFLEQVVIPRVALYNSYNMNYKTFHGYIMEKLSGFVDLNEIYSQDNLDYYKKVWIARNLCILTKQIHSIGQVVGDYNPDNVAVFPNLGVSKFIDTDSFQFVINRDGKLRLCPCNVGVAEFLAPEIHRRLISEKANLENVTQGLSNPLFTEYTDRYSLSYHIFSLLMGGCSPFAGMIDMDELAQHKSKTVSNVEVDELKAARNGEFLFSKRIALKKPPIYAPKYRILTTQLQKLFERAFVDGASDPKARPDEEEFYRALEEYLETLEIKCNRGHYMSSKYIGGCEWCRVKKEKDKLSK